MPSQWNDPKYLAEHPEIKQQAEELAKKIDEALQKLRNDKEANIIFARQDYEIKSGSELGLDNSLEYLYIDLSGSDSDWELAEKKLKNAVKSISRLDPDSERKAIEAIKNEREGAEQGLGMIFG